MITKTRKLSIRVSEDELAGIRKKAAQAQLNLTDYVVKSCLRQPITVIPYLKEVLAQQRAIGNNLNQLTTLAHLGRVHVVDLSRLSQEHAALQAGLRALMEGRRWPQ